MTLPPFLFFKQFLKMQPHISASMAKNGQHVVSQNSDKYMTSQVFFRAECFLLKTDVTKQQVIDEKTWCESVLPGQLNSRTGQFV